MPTYTVFRDGDVLEDAVFDVDPVVDTSNPFGNYAVIKMDDRGGEKFSEYERGTRIDVLIDPDGETLSIQSGDTVTTSSGGTDSYTTVFNAGTYENAGTVQTTGGDIDRFTGYVVERRETEQSGADVLEVEAYSFDQFLRRNTVTNDQSGSLISEALQDIITTDTPVSYVAGNINVGDDQELTRGYQGVSVEEALRDLAFKSNNETFGVNDSLEFFFRPRETEHIDRGVDNTQWFNYDIPELGKEAINEVEVWFNDGDESVIVDDGTDKLDLQDNLGLPDPGTQRHELNRPLITDISDAEDIGRKYLAFRNSTLSGTVTTYGLFDASPGDTIDITIEPRGIDGEFLIAGIEYRWGRDQTILTIVEKRGDVDDILSELNDSVQRVEMEGADRDAPSNRITTTNATAIVDVSVDADGNTPDGVRFVNDGRRLVRDAWTGESPPTVDTLAVGDDGGGLSRSNTSLNNQTASVSVSESLPTATSVQYTGSVSQTGVSELGLFTSGGVLVARAVFDSPVDLAGDVSVLLTVSNDDSVSRGVLTSSGQTAVRDILANNSPAIPDSYAYGSDGTAVSESDTALGNSLVTVSLEDVVITQADTTSEWEADVPSPASSDSYVVRNNQLELLQTLWTLEAEDGNGGQFTQESGLSGGAGREIFANGETVSVSFTNDHLITTSNWGMQFRARVNNSSHPAFEVNLDGSTIISVSADALLSGLNWRNLTSTVEVQPGNHTIEFVATSNSNDGLLIDIVAPYDNRFTYNFDNTVDANNALSGPENYPLLYELAFTTETTRRNVTETTVTQDWNNTENSQYVEARIGGDAYTRANNSEMVTHTGGPDTSIDVRLGLSRYTSDGTTTPTNGDSGQTVATHLVTADPDAVMSDDIGATVARAIVSPNTITGETVREAGLKSGSTLLTRHELAEFQVLADQRLASAETTRFTGNN